ncbi:MAG: DNA polymerase III subunit delta' [Clostridiales bacterium]|nr:DNA polymerase III subunit delta' [Clostridiales bacterium]HBM79420.1 DNA polymerase III subunit delta' [Clostridiaceae bacterium]
MVFEDIVGQNNIIKYLKNTIANKRVFHAYLFCGPDGIGKSIVASVFARTLNCANKGLNPCGTCPSCIKARDGNHPDITDLRPASKSISVNDIRELQINMQKKPYEDGVKVYIIHEAEKMTEQAQNALLKILEEPPEHVIIILLTFNQYLLLNTIRSRCQILKFSRAPEKAIEDYLIFRKQVPEREARFASAFSGGIFQKAVEFIADDKLKADRNDVIKLSLNIYKKDKIDVLSYVDYFTENKDNIMSILDIMVSLFRDILIYKESGSKRYIINLDKSELIESECKRYTYGVLNKIITYIKEAYRNISLNVNYQLSIENMLLKIQEG